MAKALRKTARPLPAEDIASIRTRARKPPDPAQPNLLFDPMPERIEPCLPPLKPKSPRVRIGSTRSNWTDTAWQCTSIRSVCAFSRAAGMTGRIASRRGVATAILRGGRHENGVGITGVRERTERPLAAFLREYTCGLRYNLAPGATYRGPHLSTEPRCGWVRIGSIGSPTAGAARCSAEARFYPPSLYREHFLVPWNPG